MKKYLKEYIEKIDKSLNNKETNLEKLKKRTFN